MTKRFEVLMDDGFVVRVNSDSEDSAKAKAEELWKRHGDKAVSARECDDVRGPDEP